MLRNQCLRCNHCWVSRTEESKKCPKCQSFAWNRLENKKIGRKQNTEKEFHERVDKTSDCWIWTGTINSNGYGLFKLNGKQQTAHRISYSIYINPDIGGKIIRHSCDNPRCVNPAHLTEGTTQDNVDDRVNRKRSAVGAKNFNTKLSKENVDEIRKADYSKRGTASTLARKLGISHTALNNVLNNLVHRS